MASKVRPAARIFSRSDSGSIVPSSPSVTATRRRIDHGEGLGAGPLEQDRALALVAGERGAVETWRPLSGVVEVDHEAVDETVGGGDLKVAAEILGH